MKKRQQFTPAQPGVQRSGTKKSNGDGIKIFAFTWKMRVYQHNRTAPKACDKKHPTVNIAVLALCSFVCPSVWFLPGEFQLPGFLDEENPVGLCAWGSQGAWIKCGTPFMWSGNRVPSPTDSFQKSLVVSSASILHFMPGMGSSSRYTEQRQFKVEEIWTKARKAGYPVAAQWRPPRWSGSWRTQCKRRAQNNCVSWRKGQQRQS